MNKKLKLLVLLVAGLVITSCSEYQKALKNEDVKAKYEMAEKLFEEKKYKKAIRLFEQIAPNYAGKPQGERIYYFLANSYFHVEDYYLAAYQFERFAKSYPKSEKVEEALYKNALSQYKISPKYSIDQTETVTALEKLQAFINKYPESEFLEEANKMSVELRTKLEKKVFEIAKQYSTIRDYKPAVKALDLFLAEYPGSPYRENALYEKYLATYYLAMNSILAKQEERLNEAIVAYNSFKKFYPESEFLKEADRMLENINKELERFNKNT